MARGIDIKDNKSGFFLTQGNPHAMSIAVVNSRSSAFTLIELLIVVAIIAILAAIAVPNFLEAQTRAKVARVVADMRIMEPAVVLYQVDNNKFPVRHDNWETPGGTIKYAPPLDEKVLDPTQPDARVGMKMLTTPISYLSSLPKDVFNQPIIGHRASYPDLSDAIDYYDDLQLQALRKTVNGGAGLNIKKNGFGFVSVGPDQFMGLVSSASNPTYPPETFQYTNTMRYFYDATNGTTSKGNIYRFSDNNSQSGLFPTR